MTKRRNYTMGTAFIAVVLLIGCTLATALVLSKRVAVELYPIEINKTINTTQDMDGVSVGDTIIDKMSFVLNTESKAVYVRAAAFFSVDKVEYTDEDKMYILGANSIDLNTTTTASYSWVRLDDGYYYLVDTAGNPLRVTSNSEYVFCEGATLQNVVVFDETLTAPSGLMFNANIQALEARSTASIDFATLSNKFKEIYGSDSILGYVVNFESNGGSAVSNQIFLNNYSSVTVPTPPTKDGFNFAGWYTDADCLVEYNFSSTVSSNFILYAKWVEIPKINIVLPNGSSIIFQNNDLSLSNVILSNEQIHNCNLYIDSGFTDALRLSDTLENGDTIYVESTTDNVNYTFSSDNSYLVVGDNTTTPNNGYLSGSSNTSNFIISSYRVISGEVYPVKEIGQYAFSGNTTMTQVTIPADITKIGVYAFNTCTDLADIRYFAYAVENLDGTNYTFSLAGTATSGMEVVFGCNVNSIPAWLFMPDTTRSNTPNLTSVIFAPNSRVVSLNSPFRDCTGLTSIVIPNSVESIGVSALMGCSGLNSITIQGGSTLNGRYVSTYNGVNTNSIIVISENNHTLLAGCKNSVVPSGITQIYNNAFYFCTELTSISLPSTVTRIGDWAFNMCEKLTGITLPSNLTYIGDRAFNACYNLGGTINIPGSVTTIGDYAFCFMQEGASSDVTSIIIQPGASKTIGDYAFYGYANATTATLGEGIISVGEWAFAYLGITGTFQIPSSLQNIGSHAFYSLNNVDNFVIGSANLYSDLSSVGSYAFDGRNDGAVFYMYLSYPPVTATAGFGTYVSPGFYVEAIYVPNQYLEAFRSYWSKLSDFNNYTDVTFGMEKITIVTSNGNIEVREYNMTNASVYAYLNSAYNLYSDSTYSTLRYPDSTAISYNSVLYGELCTSTLTYTLSSDSTFAILSGISNSSTPTAVVVSSTYKIPNTDTSVRVEQVAASAFSNKTNITSVKFPDSIKQIGEHAFQFCSGIISVKLPKTLTSVGDFAFSDCANITSITLNGASSIFTCQNNCLVETASKTVVLGCKTSQIPSGVLTIGTAAFCGSGLTSITLPAGLLEIGYCAFNRTLLSSITIPNGVITVGEASFTTCTNLTTVSMPNTVQQIGEFAFGDCSQLTSITIPTSVTSIGNYAFENTSRLTTVNFNATNCNDLVDNNYAFSNAGSSTSGIKVTFASGVTRVPANLFYPVSNSNTYAPNIISATFNGASLNVISNNAFAYCDTLATITFSNTTGLTTIGDAAFYNNSGLTSINIPNSVTTVGNYAFYGCSALQTITIGTGVNSIGNYAFANSNNLTTINFNATNCNDLASSNSVFYVAGQSVAGITVTVGSNVTKIPAYLFNPSDKTVYSPKISSVSFAEGSVCKSIGNYAFAYCNDLNSITTPASLTGIGSYAFYYCDSLKSITIPANVTSIGQYAFSESGLNSASFKDTSGWYTTQTEGATSGATISSMLLMLSINAAMQLTTFHDDVYWYKR